VPELSPGFFLQGGAVVILAAVAMMVFTGKLVAKRELDDVRKDRDDRLAEMRGIMTTWQQAYISSEAARQVSAGQVNQLLETGRIAEALLRAMPHPESRELPGSPGGNPS
jgi:hypothetical protein